MRFSSLNGFGQVRLIREVPSGAGSRGSMSRLVRWFSSSPLESAIIFVIIFGVIATPKTVKTVLIVLAGHAQKTRQTCGGFFLNPRQEIISGPQARP